MRSRTAITTGAIAATAALVWGVPTLAQADESPSDSSSGSALPEAVQDRRDAMRADLADRLAEELGIDADKVAAALEKVGGEMRAEHEAERLTRLEERLASAVENGRLTQERADELLQAAKDGDLRDLMGRGHRGMRDFGRGGPWSDTDDGADSGTDSGSTTSFTL